MPYSREDYIFFWKAEKPNGWAAQWHRSFFTAPIADAVKSAATESETNTFPTAEHWMMACKAALFNDTQRLNLILKDARSTRPNPKAVKALGRKISPFDEAVWVEAREDIVYQGNLHKFKQDEGLKQLLIGTGDKIIVEASPRDAIWGIGFSESKAMTRRDDWGLNLLGEALMKVRTVLREEADQK